MLCFWHTSDELKKDKKIVLAATSNNIDAYRMLQDLTEIVEKELEIFYFLAATIIIGK